MGNDTSLTRRSQRGQAAFEFIFAMLVLMGMIAVLFQVLHFELDIFNKTMIARYKLLEEARQDEDTTRPRMITTTIEGKAIEDLIPWTVPFQSTSGEKYGPKEVYWKCGTQYLFPGGEAGLTGFKVGIGALMVADHIQDLSGNSETLFSALGDVTGGLGSICQ
jgi:hypothetical protein